MQQLARARGGGGGNVPVPNFSSEGRGQVRKKEIRRQVKNKTYPYYNITSVLLLYRLKHVWLETERALQERETERTTERERDRQTDRDTERQRDRENLTASDNIWGRIPEFLKGGQGLRKGETYKQKNTNNKKSEGGPAPPPRPPRSATGHLATAFGCYFVSIESSLKRFAELDVGPIISALMAFHCFQVSLVHASFVPLLLPFSV